MKTTLKFLLNEYVTNEILRLRDFLNLTDDQKRESLIDMFGHLIHNFLEDEIENGNINPDDYDVDYAIDDPYDFIEDHRDDSELMRSFGRWLFEELESWHGCISEEEKPTWFYMSRGDWFENRWLVHFTEHAHDIAHEGFTRGVDDYTKLGLTTRMGDFEKKYGGYNFAYDIDDFHKYYRNRHGHKYGSEAVMFVASGIRVSHYSDEEPQMIFYGNTAKDIIPITETDGGYGVCSVKTGDVLYESEEIKDVVYWISKNFVQYRKQLIKR